MAQLGYTYITNNTRTRTQESATALFSACLHKKKVAVFKNDFPMYFIYIFTYVNKLTDLACFTFVRIFKSLFAAIPYDSFEL